MAEYENRKAQQRRYEEALDLIVTVSLIVMALYGVYLALA